MSELSWIAEPKLDRPILAIALKGLFDVAGSATDAIRHIGREFDTTKVAEIDPETFFDFSQERPVVSLDETGVRSLTWPSNEAFAAPNSDGRDLLLLAGIEPHLRWRSFSEAVVELAREADAELVVTLGAMVGMAPHTRALGVVGSSTNAELARRMGLGRPSYEGPTGLVGALHDSLDKADLPVISLRVSVPHYVPSPPNPQATRSLLARFELVTGIKTNHATLDSAAADWRTRVDAAVANDSDMTQYVAELERQVDSSADELLPSGDDLAAELQAFLRDQRDD